jgi:hypothetical protein
MFWEKLAYAWFHSMFGAFRIDSGFVKKKIDSGYSIKLNFGCFRIELIFSFRIDFNLNLRITTFKSKGDFKLKFICSRHLYK